MTLRRWSILSFMVVAFGASGFLRAEPVVNLPNTPVEEESQEAARALLDSIIGIYRAIRALEVGSSLEEVNGISDEAVSSAVDAEDTYKRIQDTVKGVSVENFGLPETREEYVLARLSFYKIDVPDNLVSLVEVVVRELELYRGRVEDYSSFSGSLSDNVRIDNLQDAINRIMYVGTTVPYFTKREE